MNPHHNLLTFLGGGSRKLGLWVLLALLGAVAVFLGRLTWEKWLGGLGALAAIVSIAWSLEDAAEKKAKATPPAPPSAIAIANETTNTTKEATPPASSE